MTALDVTRVSVHTDAVIWERVGVVTGVVFRIAAARAERLSSGMQSPVLDSPPTDSARPLLF